MKQLSSQYIVDIIKEEMTLTNRNVWLRDQNAFMPPDKDLYIIVGIVQTQVMAAESYMISSTPENYDNTNESWDQPTEDFDETNVAQVQVTEVQAKEMVQIDVLSRSNAGIFRVWEVIAALNSFYSQQTQELNNFKIFRIPQSYINTSVAEGSSMLNRYTITFPCFVWYRKETVLTLNGGDYYDDFTTQVDDSKTIGTPTPLIEFEINQEGIEP